MPSYQAFAKMADKAMTDWLYSGWSKEKVDTFTGLYAIPGIHQYIDYKLDLRRDNEYMARYGMNYSDIHDPRKLSSVGSGARAIEWVSGNIKRLYK